MGDDGEKLLARIRQSSANCKREELIALYIAFGFKIENRTNHDIAVHTKFPELRATIGRHKRLSVAYFRTAVRLVDAVKRRLQEEAQNEQSGTPQTS